MRQSRPKLVWAAAVNLLVSARGYRFSRIRQLFSALLITTLLATLTASCRHGHGNGGSMEPELAGWVREVLADDPRVPQSASIAVEVSAGFVTLTGQVPTLSARRYAVIEVQKLRGVWGVIDRLQVSQSPQSDREVTAEIERRLRAALADLEARVSVSTTQGRVWLDGDVATWAEVEQAGLVAAQVLGVREVSNRVAARREFPAGEDAVRERIEGAFERDVALAHLSLQVVVAPDGEVSIEGQVGNAYERQLALRRARNLALGGAVSDRIRVVPLSDPRRTAAEAPEGDALANVVRTELALDPRLRDAAIEVTAEGRLVFLDGSVRDLGQKRIAERDARNVIGVAWVTNDLTPPPSDRSDAELRAELARALRAIPALRSILYEVSGGVVTLRGSAPDWAARALASVVAAGVAGVQEIRSELQVATGAETPDIEIAERVARGFERNWTTGFVAQRVTVDVDQGVVRLSGDVNTWGQWHAAQRIARRTPGARAVVNELGVDPYPFTLERPADSKTGWLDHDSPDVLHP